MDILKNKFVVGGVGAVLVLTLAYYLWTSAENSALLTTNDGTSPLSQEILITLGQLHPMRLDRAMFPAPVFASLTDCGVPIPPQNAGRRNPFAPVGK